MGHAARARRRWRAVALAALPAALVVPSTAGAQPPPTPPGGTAPLSLVTSFSPSDTIEGAKSASSALAKTDPSLLGRKDATPIAVMVKLDYDAAATYTGDIRGLPATSPQVTGKRLTEASPAERQYDQYMASQEQTFTAALRRSVPNARVGRALRTVYGGIALTIPANQVATVLKLPGVVAVQVDKVEHPQTDASPAFIGATSLYPALGGATNAGKGVIIGVLDTGLWPEHPSFVDNGNLPSPPPTTSGAPRECNFGDNPLTPAADVFHCNNKLIGGQPFLATYLSVDPGAATEVYPSSARDSNGHGTHTSSTAAGDVLASAKIFGVERGPIGGIAPGAYVEMFKVCGLDGCYASDSMAAVQQAIADNVNVINFSIGGGSNPATDPVELAFLDAYAAGVFVAASAGNSGPGASTAEHLSPWVTTVAASTQAREFDSTLTLTADNGEQTTMTGASIMGGVSTPTPVVQAAAAPYSDNRCTKPAPPGLFVGKIVVCARGTNGRVEKGFNVSQGGAAGMILYNPTLADVETDNHFLPAIHLADGTQLLAFLTTHTGVTATFTAGQKAFPAGAGDVMAAFSSRGPGGNFIKPDVTAPGVQILAGASPTPDEVASGPSGQYFQAIAGTSMSSPHVAGSAILLKALHPDWTPGQIKSALMTTGVQNVLKEDKHTPADPFDFGSGRIDLTKAGNPGLTFDASADQMRHHANDPLTSADVNIASLDIPVLPGRLDTTRVAKNVSGQRVRYDVEVTSPPDATITVSPNRFTLASEQTATLGITVTSTVIDGKQRFGEIRLVPAGRGLPTLHLPVAFVPQQTPVELTQTCDPGSIVKGANTFCTVTATNGSYNDVTVNLTTEVSKQLKITAAQGATVTHGIAARLGQALAGRTPGNPSIAPGQLAGYIPLALFGTAPAAVGDETLLNFNVTPFLYGGVAYNRIGVTSDGYLVVGGGTTEDIQFVPRLPDTARPNNVLAPFWTDLTGTGAEGIRVNQLTDGVDDWVVVEWKLNVVGTTSGRTFQVWLGVNGTQDITYAYDPAALPADPGLPFVVGAENVNGTAGATIPGLPTQDLRVTSSAPQPGASYSYQVTVKGAKAGTGVVTSKLTSPQLAGTTVVTSTVAVTKR